MDDGRNIKIEMDEICAKVKKILDMHIGSAGQEELDNDADLREHGMDSMAFVQVIVDIEAELDIEIPDEYLLVEKMSTINKIIGIVKGLTKEDK